MARKITQYRVFIASPGGLEFDRDRVRETAREFNETTALSDRIQFAAVGWEDLPSTAGRPQDRINQLVRDSDFFLMLLHDRWGSPTNAEGAPGPSSGCEEEFALARELLGVAEHPMQDLAVYFRSVPAAQVADPGPQLARVLEFRDGLAASKVVLFAEYAGGTALEHLVRKQLSEWFRRVRRAPSTEAPLPVSGPEVLAAQVLDAQPNERNGPINAQSSPFGPDPTLLASAIERLQRVASSGSPKLHRAVRSAWQRDLGPLQSFLESKANAASNDAQRYELYSELGAVAEVNHDEEHAKRAWSEVLSIKPSDSTAAAHLIAYLLDTDEFEKARQILLPAYEALSPADPLASLICGALADANSKLGNHALAIELFEEAIRIAESQEAWYLLTRARWHLGSAYFELQDYDQTEALVSAAIQEATEGGYVDMLPNMYGTLAIALIKLNRIEEAEPWLNRSIAMLERAENRSVAKRASLNLAFLYLYRQEPAEALRVLDGLEAEIEGERKPSVRALARTNRGLALWQLGHRDAAIKSLREGQELFERVGMAPRSARVRNWLGAAERGEPAPGSDAMW